MSDQVFIPQVEGLCAEQIFVQHKGSSSAVLLDGFGRPHILSPSTTIGRDPESVDLCILESSVSREHALVEKDGEAWRIKDLGSTNGTYVQGSRVEEVMALEPGQLLVFGDVGLVFHPDGASAHARKVTESIRATRKRPTERSLRLTEPASGAAGFAEFNGQRAQLGSTQFSLLWELGERFHEESGHPEEVRGFVPSIQLLASLPWDTARPENNHLKQLVRRTRRALEQIGLADAIESRQRFGYRLVVYPDLVRT